MCTIVHVCTLLCIFIFACVYAENSFLRMRLCINTTCVAVMRKKYLSITATHVVFIQTFVHKFIIILSPISRTSNCRTTLKEIKLLDKTVHLKQLCLRGQSSEDFSLCGKKNVMYTCKLSFLQWRTVS